MGWWRRAADREQTRIREQQQEIERLRREKAEVERERDRLREERDRLEAERDRFERERDRLRDDLEAARRAAKRQAAPFSKGTPTAQPKRPGRKAGRHYGPRRWRPRPTHIDAVVDVPPPAECARCHGPVVATGDVRVQYEEDIPPVRPHVPEFRCHVGQCQQCRRRVVGRDERQTSTATGAAASPVGPNAVAWATCRARRSAGEGGAHPGHGLRAHDHAGRAGAGVAPGRRARLPNLRRAGPRRAAQSGRRPRRDGLEGRRAVVVAVGVRHAEADRLCDPARARLAQATAILGADYAGVLVRDGWAPYRQLPPATHQTGLAHLLRRCHVLLETAQRGAARVPHAVRRLLLRAPALRARRDAGALHGHGLRVAIGRLEAATDRMLAGRGVHPPNRRLLRHLATERGALSTFLDDRAVAATNWRAEQAIRPAVVTRKVCGGNRTPYGADTQQIIASVLRTCAQQDRDPFALLIALQCARRPVVANLCFD